MRKYLLLAALLPLLACQHPGTSGPSLAVAPTPPPPEVHCSAAMVAQIPAEPLPPSADAGVIHSALESALPPGVGDALFSWAFVEEPTWGRGAARQTDQARAWCRELDAKQARP